MAYLLQFYKTINFLNHIFKSFISFLENLIIYILHFTSSPPKKNYSCIAYNVHNMSLCGPINAYIIILEISLNERK